MVGVSIAIIGIVRLIEARAAEATMIDDVTSAASVALWHLAAGAHVAETSIANRPHGIA